MPIMYVDKKADERLKSRINTKAFDVEEFPEDGMVRVCVSPKLLEMNPNLQGVILGKCNSLSNEDKEILRYWNKTYKIGDVNDEGIIYYQNEYSSYFVELEELCEHEVDNIDVLTEGFTVSFKKSEAFKTLFDLDPEQFVEILFSLNDVFFDENIAPKDADLVDVSSDMPNTTSFSVFIKIGDFQESPGDYVHLNLFNYELMDYGYYY